ncbi:MAG TPA: hypothetical protein VH442_16135 [Micromonosporaceae bacterium]
MRTPLKLSGVETPDTAPSTSPDGVGGPDDWDSLSLGERLARVTAAEWPPRDEPAPPRAVLSPASAFPTSADVTPTQPAAGSLNAVPVNRAPVDPTAVPSSPPIAWRQPDAPRPGTYEPANHPPTSYPPPSSAPPSAAGHPWPSQRGWPPPYPPHVLAGRRRRRGPAVTLLVIAIVVAVIASIGFAIAVSNRPRSPAAALGVITHASPSAPTASPRSLRSVLTAQTTALLAGDRDAFMAGVDPAASATVTAYQRLFANLRALHVTVWNQSADGDARQLSGVSEFDVDVSYCFVVTNCKDMTATMTVTATVRDGRAVIETYKPPATSQRFDTPIPWQAATLTAVTGSRVVVAATAAEASRLRDVLPIAERAARAADTYAKWGRPPLYLVYLAGPSDARTWFGGGLEHSTGEAIGLSETDIEVMVVLPEAAESRYSGPGTLGTVLQHEMGHVATLYGDNQQTGHDSLIEGIAEYVAYNGHPSWAAYRLDNTREYVQSGKWSGQCYLTKEISSDDVLTGSAAYGIGYLMIKRLVAKYGLAKALAFWSGVERESLPINTAATTYLGTSWKSVNSDCASYIRHTLHA